MPYIGQNLQVAYPTYLNIDDISGSFNGSTTSFALLVNGAAPVPLPLNSQQCLISVGGVIQRPDDSGTEGFRLSGGNIIFSSAPNTGEDFFGVILAGADYVNVGANFPDGSQAAPSITFEQDNDTGFYRSGSGLVSVSSNNTKVFTFPSTAGSNGQYLQTDGAGTATWASVASDKISEGNTEAEVVDTGSDGHFKVTTEGSERLRVDPSGRLLVGTSTSLSSYGINGLLNVASNGLLTRDALFSYFKNDIYGPILTLAKSRSDSIGTFTYPTSGDLLGTLAFSGAHTGNGRFDLGARIDGYANQTWTSTAQGSYLTFSTTADGASSPTERMRITNSGVLRIGQSTSDGPGITGDTVVGTALGANGYIAVNRDGNAGLYVGRKTNDGDLVYFNQDGNLEGTISVSGTAVSYNGAHLSRWSQLPSGAERIEILRGSVLSNIDEMCEWGEEDNEQLNRMKVSDVEGDKNVSGVFQCWDDDDDTYTNDFYCAMTGDFIIRIAADVTVERGDLLMSAGDGTAKPQDDDIIRSKTIAKVTSTTVSCTYDDGSYCVPCVLMAC